MKTPTASFPAPTLDACGDVRALPMPGGEDMTAARYNGIAANDDIIIGANMSPDFDMLFMSRSTERLPESPTNTKNDR